MAFKPVGIYKSVKMPVKLGEAVIYGACYKVDTTGELTLASTTDIPKYVALEAKSANATYQVMAEFVQVTPDQEFIVDVVDANGDCIGEAATSGVATGLYINDTANRNEADNAFRYGTLYLPYLKNPYEPGCQARAISASDQSDTRVTVYEPFVKVDGTAYTTNTDKYIVTTLAPGQRDVVINSAGTGIEIEAANSGGAVILLGYFDLSGLPDGKVRQRVTFDV